jgi:general secretion pathway protein A
MYENFYRLRESPFALTPDPKYLFLADGHKEALASVAYGIQQRKGFVLIVGEVGTGKTTIIRHILKQFGDRLKVVYVFNARVTFEELLKVTLRELEIPCPSAQRLDMIEALNEFLLREAAAGRYVVMIIDEAQHLTAAVLEEIRMLSNLETAQGKLLQIVLVGQPELGAKLALPGLRQLRQRIALVAELEPLTAEETAGYIAHRLKVAGHPGTALFTPAALKKIYRASRGLPRIINVICDKALILGYAAGAKRIRRGVIKQALADQKVFAGGRRRYVVQEGRRMAPRRQRRALVPLASAALVLAVAAPAAWLALHRSAPSDVPAARSESRPAMVAAVPVPVTPRPTPAPESRPASGSRPVPESRVSGESRPVPTPASRPGTAVAPAEAASVATSPEPSRPGRTEMVSLPVAPPRQPEFVEVDVEEGDTLNDLLLQRYGRVDLTLLDVVKRANPGLRSVDLIEVGRRIRLPRVVPGSMVWPIDDQHYAVHVATVASMSQPAFAPLKSRVERSGKKLHVVPVRLGDDMDSYRVLVGDFSSREEAEAYYRRYWAPTTASSR